MSNLSSLNSSSNSSSSSSYDIDVLCELTNPQTININVFKKGKFHIIDIIQHPKLQQPQMYQIHAEFSYTFDTKEYKKGKFFVIDTVIKKNPVDTSKLRYLNESERPFSNLVMTKGRFSVYE